MPRSANSRSACSISAPRAASPERPTPSTLPVSTPVDLLHLVQDLAQPVAHLGLGAEGRLTRPPRPRGQSSTRERLAATTWSVSSRRDDSGSTEYIINQVQSSAAGSIWAVGTEIHLVNRLAREVHPDRTVHSLDQFGCLCSTMFRVSPNHLLWILEGLVEGRVHNRITVPDDQKKWTKVALDRMLTIR
jgi:hypothetical protein